jgi:extracellular elastinolytic metalloproteinase
VIGPRGDISAPDALTARAARGSVAAARTDAALGRARALIRWGASEGETMPFKLFAAFAALVSVLFGFIAASAAMAASGGRDFDEIAFRYIRENAADFGVTPADVANLAVTTSYRSKHNRVTHVNVQQQLDGMPVQGAHATVNIAHNRKVIFAAGALRPLTPATGTAQIDAAQAVKAAADALDLAEPDALRVLQAGTGAEQETVVSDGGISREAIPASLVYQPIGSGSRLAWQLTIDDSAGEHLWNAVVDAETGELLNADDWTAHDTYEGLESALSRDGGGGASSPIRTPSPVIDGSSYTVFGWPNESPNDASRTRMSNPADRIASPFGWHDTDADRAPEFTITQGNNAHAYLDQDDDEAADFGGNPDGGAGLDFHFPADLNEHAQAYRDAVVANLFYGNNMIHDVLYRYGFDDEAGNFQVNNYGRGGNGGDPVRAEAADGSGTNNANFSTPAMDGLPPRMQMFLWPGNQLGPQNLVTVDGVGTFGARWARFGPPATSAGISGRALVYGGTGCEAGQYPAGLPDSGWIAVVDGIDTDECPYLLQVHVAEGLGAEAVVVADVEEEDNPPILDGSMVEAPPGIPAVSVTQADGTAIKAALAAGTRTGGVQRNTARAPIRDGDFDHGIINHEYGHGVSNRLTGGPMVNCLTGNEQAGEGWSDFMAITLLIDPRLDDPDLTRGLVPYALFQPNRMGNGLRPRPYSRNMTIQPFTYDSIKTGGWLNGTSLALPHGLGHGWAAVLWDMTWDLIDKHGFNPNLYGPWWSGGNNRAIQYVIDGLKFQGCGPGLVRDRAAIIAAADELADGKDNCTLWASFARRGLGFSAVQGTTNRDDNSEAFDTHPGCRRGFERPISAPYGQLNTVRAGSEVDLEFEADDFSRRNLLASNSPYSRQVDCTTLATVTPGQTFITPRPAPVPTVGDLDQRGRDEFEYEWETLGEWAGTCREVVLTRQDGKQHRAFMRFT